MVQVKKFYAFNDLRNYSYLILDDQSGDCWVIDPYEADPMIDYIKKESMNLRAILNTHQHFDHIRGNEPLSKEFGSPIRKLRASENLELGGEFALQTIDSPGHTMDHQVFVWKQKQKAVALFSGDTLFNAGVGNCRNGGNVESLYSTVEMLIKSLPAETLLYPGHDYLERNLLFAKTLEPENKIIDEQLKKARAEAPEARQELRLGEEMGYNPFFRLDSEELQKNLKGSGNSLEDAEINRRNLFKQIRKLRDQW